MKTSTLLKLAEKYLWDGKDLESIKARALCNAIDHAALCRGRKAMPAWRLANRAIRKALGGHNYYSGWARKNGYLPMNWENTEWFWWPIIQANRLNWLRELQRQFKAKGD